MLYPVTKNDRKSKIMDIFEDLCSKLQGIFDCKDESLFLIRSLTPQQAAGNALAGAVHGT